MSNFSDSTAMNIERKTSDSNRAPGFEYYLKRLREKERRRNEEISRETSNISQKILIYLGEREDPVPIIDLISELEMKEDINKFVDVLIELSGDGWITITEAKEAELTESGQKFAKLVEEI